MLKQRIQFGNQTRRTFIGTEFRVEFHANIMLRQPTLTALDGVLRTRKIKGITLADTFKG
jgi:hypothetical protein